MWEITSPILANTIKQEATYLLNTSQQPPNYMSIQLPLQNIELWFLPNSGNTAFQRLMNIFYQAKTSIRVAMYTWTHPRIADAIIDAHERGVKIEVVLDHDQALDAGFNIYIKLTNAGVPVALSTSNDILHYKMAWIDNTILVNGSANWTLSAFNKNDDCFVVINPLSANQQETMELLWKKISSEASYKIITPVLQR